MAGSLRILIVVPNLHPESGGPPRVVIGHALELARRGLRPEVLSLVTPHQRSAVRESLVQLEENRVPVHLFRRVRPLALGFAPALVDFVDQNVSRFDVVHLHGAWLHCLTATAWASRKHSVPYVLAPHGCLDRWSRSRSRHKKALSLSILGAKRMFHGASALQYGTAEEAEEASDLGLPGRAHIIPNGTTPRASIGPERKAAFLAGHPSLVGAYPIFLFFSRIHPKKGLDLLVDAFAKVAGNFPTSRLLIVGIPEDAEYERTVRRRIESHGLERSVIMTSQLVGESARVALHTAHVLVQPSHEEGFSMAVVEAMQQRLAVLVTDRCHMNFVASIRSGLVVPPKVESLADGLRKLAGQNRAALAAMGQRGESWVAEHCSWPKIGDALESMYNGVIAAESRRHESQ